MKKLFVLLLIVCLLSGCGQKPTPTTPTASVPASTTVTNAPTVPDTIPTETTTIPTEVTTIPTEVTTIPTEVTTIPTEPTVIPTEPTVIPTEPTTETAPPTTETTAPTTDTEPEEVVHSPYYIPNYSVGDVITYFNEINTNAEMVHGGNATLIQKWVQPIYYYIHGEPTGEDLTAINDFVSWVNTIPGFPGMYSTTDIGQANMNMYFCTEQELKNIMGPGFDGLDGAVTYWYNNNAIYNATICIRTDIGQYVRNSVIKEEFYNGLGPINDTWLRTDSLVYAGYSEPQAPTAMDKLIMVLLYNPQIQCGMTGGQCAEVIRQLYY